MKLSTRDLNANAVISRRGCLFVNHPRMDAESAALRSLLGRRLSSLDVSRYTTAEWWTFCAVSGAIGLIEDITDLDSIATGALSDIAVTHPEFLDDAERIIGRARRDGN